MVGLSVETETSVVERARAGDRVAFGALAEKYSAPLVAFARRRCASTDEAHDAVQAALAQALSGLAGLADVGAFRGWLYGITLNECLKRRRKSSRLRRALAGLRELVAGPALAPEPVDQEAIRAAVARLPEKQRVTVELRIWEGLSCAEAALALGCSEGTVKANFHHALKKLRVELEEHGA